jgi:hypothetical protein
LEVFLPERFKNPRIKPYKRTTDPTDHLEAFVTHLELHGTLDEIAYRAFNLTLEGNAQEWFASLPANLIDDLKSFSKMFIT